MPPGICRFPGFHEILLADADRRPRMPWAADSAAAIAVRNSGDVILFCPRARCFIVSLFDYLTEHYTSNNTRRIHTYHYQSKLVAWNGHLDIPVSPWKLSTPTFLVPMRSIACTLISLLVAILGMSAPRLHITSRTKKVPSHTSAQPICIYSKHPNPVTALFCGFGATYDGFATQEAPSRRRPPRCSDTPAPKSTTKRLTVTPEPCPQSPQLGKATAGRRGHVTYLPSSRPASAAATEPWTRQMPALRLQGGALCTPVT
jgi:hypothetical protein